MTFTDDDFIYAAIHIKKTIGRSYTFEDIAKAAFDYLEQTGHIIVHQDFTKVRWAIECRLKGGREWIRRGPEKFADKAEALVEKDRLEKQYRSHEYRLAEMVRSYTPLEEDE
jgi:hypothetical protein